MIPNGAVVISVVSAVRDSLPFISELIERTVATLEKCGEPFEIIFVNDGSRDQTWEIIREASTRYPEIRGLDLQKSFGQHNALLTGVLNARGEIIVTIDDDLEQSPESIPVLLDKLSEGYDAVFGIAKLDRRPFLRRITSRLGRAFISRLTPHRLCGSPLRAFLAELRDGFGKTVGRFSSLDVQLSWSMQRAASVEVEFERSRRKQSGYRFGDLLTALMTGVTGISLRPLQFSIFLGLLCLAGALVFALAAFFHWWSRGSVVTGWLTVAGGFLFCGLQSCFLGILGEYVGRIYFQGQGFPLSVVKRRIGWEEA